MNRSPIDVEALGERERSVRPTGFVIAVTDDHRYAPRLHCAGCGAPIDDAHQAGVVFAPSASASRAGDVRPAVVLCKANQCLSRDPRFRHWLWQPLSVYLVWLLQNSGLGTPRAFADARRRADMNERIG